MNNLNEAQKAKANKVLSTLIRYSDGVMTRRDWLKAQIEKGAFVVEGTKNRIQYNRIKFNRFSSYKEQEEYMKKCEELIVCYLLKYNTVPHFYEITKTEFDYFNSLTTKLKLY